MVPMNPGNPGDPDIPVHEPAHEPVHEPVYAQVLATHSEIEAIPGALLLQFGVGWCGHCQASEPAIAQALQSGVHLTHLRIEDGPGRALGRAFKIKLWPTLVLLQDGHETGRLVRPTQAAEVQVFLEPLRALTQG